MLDATVHSTTALLVYDDLARRARVPRACLRSDRRSADTATAERPGRFTPKFEPETR